MNYFSFSKKVISISQETFLSMIFFCYYSEECKQLSPQEIETVKYKLFSYYKEHNQLTDDIVIMALNEALEIHNAQRSIEDNKENVFN